jgi:hypothetical protein
MLIDTYDVQRRSARHCWHRCVLELPQNMGTQLGVLFLGDRPVSL